MSKTLIVTGANGDLGSTIVERALDSDQFDNILAVSRGKGEWPTRSARLRHLSGIDLTEEASARRLSDYVEHLQTDSITLIHSVGDFWEHKPLCSSTFQEVLSQITSHTLTLMYAMKSVTPKMIALGSGRIIAFSCNSVTFAYPDMSPFTASKAFVEECVRCYSNENGCLGVGALCIELPTVLTEKVIQKKSIAESASYLTPDDVASLILDHLVRLPHECTGSVIRAVKYNSTFYRTSYYERNPSASE